MRYLLLSSFLLLLFSCSSSYRNLQPAADNAAGIDKFRPDYTVALYTTQVDVLNKHLSGLLMIKRMPDSSTRVVFTSEMGFKFFDFEFSEARDFKVHYIIDQMNKKAVIKTLQKDFELVLMKNLDHSKAYVRKDDQLLYYVFPRDKGFYHYVTNSETTELLRMERASKKKPVVLAIMKDFSEGMPDTVGISHTNFKFNIGLKQIRK